jgi:trans-aconitate methyltransferase
VFVEWLKQKNCIKNRILDVGCGAGANTNYMASIFRDVDFVGLEIDEELVAISKEHITESNCQINFGNIYSTNNWQGGGIEGIVSFQFLSWIDGYEKAIDNMMSLNPRWIAASSLFNEGDIQYNVMTENYSNDPVFVGRQNVYSLNRFKKFLSQRGYDEFDYMKFEIDIDLPCIDSTNPGTYTETLIDGRRLQISANFLMPWYFVFASR